MSTITEFERVTPDGMQRAIPTTTGVIIGQYAVR